MKPNITIRSAAYRDLHQHADFIAKSNRRAGRRFFKAAQSTLQRLADFPEVGGLCEIENPHTDWHHRRQGFTWSKRYRKYFRS